MQFFHIAAFFAKKSRHIYHTERTEEGMKHLASEIVFGAMLLHFDRIIFCQLPS
jgi:hypothetical protein